MQPYENSGLDKNKESKWHNFASKSNQLCFIRLLIETPLSPIVSHSSHFPSNPRHSVHRLTRKTMEGYAYSIKSENGKEKIMSSERQFREVIFQSENSEVAIVTNCKMLLLCKNCGRIWNHIHNCRNDQMQRPYSILNLKDLSPRSWKVCPYL